MSVQNNLPVTPVERPVVKKRSNSFFWPIVLILIGVIMLVNNFNIGLHFNWWAIFIFIPVVASLSTTWGEVRRTGEFNSAAAGSLGGAVMVGTIAVMLLLGFDWAIWWPLVVIAAGAATFINGIPSLVGTTRSSLTGIVSWSLWIGVAAILLGVGFLAIYLPIPSIKALLVGYRWWAIPILIAGIGALISALIMVIRNQGKPGWFGWGLILAGVVTLAVGAMAFYAVAWSILLPVILIAAGIVVMTGVLWKK